MEINPCDRLLMKLLQAKEFVKRMDEVASKLAALVKESDGEAAKYGQDIVLLAAFNNAQKYVSCN